MLDTSTVIVLIMPAFILAGKKISLMDLRIILVGCLEMMALFIRWATGIPESRVEESSICRPSGSRVWISKVGPILEVDGHVGGSAWERFIGASETLIGQTNDVR